MSTNQRNINDDDNDDNTHREIPLTPFSILLATEDVLRLTENSNTQGGATDICETTENYHTKQQSDPIVASVKVLYKSKTNAGVADLAQTHGTNVAANTFKEGLTQETTWDIQPGINFNYNYSIQSTITARYPGAHAVEGVNGHLLSHSTFSREEIIFSSTEIDEETPTLLTATLVLDESLCRQDLVGTTLPVLSAVPMEDPQNFRRHWRNILLAVAVLFAGTSSAIVLAISFQNRNKSAVGNSTPTTTLSPSLTPSQMPTQTPSYQPSSILEELYSIVALDLDTVLPATNTSQYKALNWLLEQDTGVEYSAEELRQRYALAALIFSSQGLPVTDVLSADSHCTWPGITCGTQEGVNEKQVIGIDINFTAPVTTYVIETCVSLPPELALLSNSIKYMRFPQFATWGKIPTELGSLTALQELVIHQQCSYIVDAALPSQIGQLSKLTHLSLRGCGIFGTLPTQIGRLTDLLHLDLGSNLLTSSIPTEIGKLTLLKHFDVASNHFNDYFPHQIGTLTNLEYFNIADNKFGEDNSGFLPLELTFLTKLEYLNAGFNKIAGFMESLCCSEESLLPNSAPYLPSYIGQLTLLTTLQLNSNRIQSSLPTEIGNLVNLVHLDLFQNQLSGSLPSTLGFLTKLSRIDVMTNLLTWTIPSELALLTNLQVADFSDNQLSGEPPNNLTKMVNLQFLNLQLNSIEGVMNCSPYSNMLSDIRVDCGEIFCNGNCTCYSFFANPIGIIWIDCPMLGENSTGF